MNIINPRPLLAAVLLLSLSACEKKKTEPDPEPDPYTYSGDLQSAKDIAFATYVVADLDMICAYQGEGQLDNPYEQIPGTGTPASGQTTQAIDASAKQTIASFNQVNCQDGYFRDGSVILSYGYNSLTNPGANPNANYYRDFGFGGHLSLVQFVINGWQVSTEGNAYVYNQLMTSSYDPAGTNISWKIIGKFKFTRPSEPGRSLVWDGQLTKTLTNTGDKNVFPDKQSAIKWNLAQVKYTGSANGTLLASNTSFNYTIDDPNPILRDLSCFFSPPGTTGVTEYHPFTFGMATCTIGNLHPRKINYAGATSNCDNTGIIVFKDETHTVTFD